MKRKSEEQKSIRSQSFREVDGLNFKEVLAGHDCFRKTYLIAGIIFFILVSSLIPIFAGLLVSGAAFRTLNGGYSILFGVFGLTLYSIILILFEFLGFEVLLILTVGGFLILSLVAARFLEQSPGIWLRLFYFNLSINIAWISVYAISIATTTLELILAFWGKYIALLIYSLIPFILVSDITNDNDSLIIRLGKAFGVAVVVLVGFLTACKAINRVRGFAWIRDRAAFWAATGGTSFYGCDLTDVSFEGADLRHTDLRKTNLIRTNFKDVTGLELSRLQGTILEQPNVRKLLIRRKDYDKDLTDSNLSGADLREADLREAILVRAQLLNADLSGACLTNACIQDWNINHNTRFKNVDCKRVYLKRSPSGHFLEPKPDGGEFGPGEFEKWITDVRDTIDLIFQNGLNWRAFAFSLTQTAINNEGIDLSVRSIENKGAGVVVAKVGVSVDTSKSSIHQEITEHYNEAVAAIEAKYELVLKAKDDEIDRLVSFHEAQQRFIQGLVAGIAEPKEKVLIQGEGNRVYVMNQTGDVMENSNQNISAGGNVDMSTGAKVTIGGDITGSSINLGQLSGQVSNTIQQLQDIKTADSNDLAKILTQLQKSINEEQMLSDAQKEQALEAVATLAEEGKKPPESRTTKFCSMAVNALKGLASTVTDANKLAEALKTSLPTLTKLLAL